MSALPPFPFPQGAGAAPATQGGVKIGPGSYPFRPSVPGELIQGLSGFVDSFIQARQVSKQNAMDKANSLISQRIQGIPVPDEEIAKAYKQAGYKLPIHSEKDIENYQAGKVAATQQTAANQASLMAGGPQTMQMPGGGMDPATAQMMTAQVPNAVAPPANVMPPRPGFWGRIGDVMGVRPPSQAQMGPGSPMADYLQRIDQAVAIGGGMPGQLARGGRSAELQDALEQAEGHFILRWGMDFNKLNAQKQMQIMDLSMRALNGDVGAKNQLVQGGAMEGAPLDAYTQVASALNPGLDPVMARRNGADMLMRHEMGLDKMPLMMLQSGQELYKMGAVNSPFEGAQYMLGGGAASGIKLNPLPENVEKISSAAEKATTSLKNIYDAVPDLPFNVATTFYNAVLTGNQPMINAISNAVTKGGLKSGKAIDLGAQVSQAASSAKRASVDQDSLLLRSYTELQDLDQKAARLIGERYDKQTENAFRSYSLSPTPEGLQGLMDIIGSGSQTFNQLTVRKNGVDVPLGNVMKRLGATHPLGSPYLSMFYGGVPYLAPGAQGSLWQALQNLSPEEKQALKLNVPKNWNQGMQK